MAEAPRVGGVDEDDVEVAIVWCEARETARQIEDGEGEILYLTPERFKGTLAFKAADRAVQARVSMNQWQVANDETVEIPHEGLLIIHLRAGALTVIIDGRESKLNENAIFSVPPGKRLSIRTDRDSIVLHIVEFASR